jgi:hypothetical protein
MTCLALQVSGLLPVAPEIDVQHGLSLSSAYWRGLVERAMCEALLVATRPWLQGGDCEKELCF